MARRLQDAQYVFLLPNKPILPDDVLMEVFLAKARTVAVLGIGNSMVITGVR